jgi:hypothetical protein
MLVCINQNRYGLGTDLLRRVSEPRNGSVKSLNDRVYE